MPCGFYCPDTALSHRLAGIRPPLARGRHRARARAWIGDARHPIETEQVDFLVK